MTEIKGPFEGVTGLVGLVFGCVAGYTLGGEAVEYARQATQNVDLLSTVVKEHPTLTYVVTTSGVGGIYFELARVPGWIADRVFHTKFPEDE